MIYIYIYYYYYDYDYDDDDDDDLRNLNVLMFHSYVKSPKQQIGISWI